MKKASLQAIQDLANATAALAESLSNNAVPDKMLTDQELHAKALLIENNAKTLANWTHSRVRADALQ